VPYLPRIFAPNTRHFPPLIPYHSTPTPLNITQHHITTHITTIALLSDKFMHCISYIYYNMDTARNTRAQSNAFFTCPSFLSFYRNTEGC